MTSAIRKLLLPLVAIAVLLTLLAWMAGLFSDKLSPGLQALPPPLAADTFPVVKTAVTLIEPASASVEAKQATLISSRIMARITRIEVRSGDTVSRGQLLLELEKTDLLSRVQQSKEQIRAISVRLKEARLNLKRVNELYQKRLVAAADLDKARANKDTLEAELAGARQAMDEAQTAVGFSEIRSPIDGRVVDRFTEPGNTAAPGQKLLALYNPLSLRIEAQVREQLALALYVGQPLEVELPSLNKTLTGELEERVPVADPGSRSFRVKVRVPFDADLLPGMYARLLVPAGTEELYLIPADRVVQVGQLNLVWVLRDGQAQRRFVRTGKSVPPDLITVFSGLTEGELILPAGN